jgi:hypothetical protein
LSACLALSPHTVLFCTLWKQADRFVADAFSPAAIWQRRAERGHEHPTGQTLRARHCVHSMTL